MKEKRLDNPSYVQFECTNDSNIDSCIAALKGSGPVSSCVLQFSNYVPSDEKMRELALAIKNSSSLESFQLFDFYNKLPEESVEIITETLKTLIHLKTVLYRGAFYKNTAQYFSELLEKTESLQVLSLGGCRSFLRVLGDKDAEIISNALLQNKTLIELHVDLNNFTGEGAKLICNALKGNTLLKALSLENNQLKRSDEELIVDILASNIGLQTLTLDEITLTPTEYQRIIGTEKAIEQSILDLKKNAAITYISLSLDEDCHLSDKSLELLYLSLKQMSRLQKLELYRFPKQSIPLIDDILWNNTNIISLTFRGEIDELGVIIFSNLIRKNNSLEYLSLAGSSWRNPSDKICDNWGEKFGQALEYNKRLVSLDLSHNLMGFKTARAIGKSLKHNNVLTSLNLSNNQLDYDSVQFIIDSLISNQTFHTLDITSNRIRFAEDEIIFLKSLEKHSRLTCLELLKHPGALTSPGRDWGYYSDFHLENKISHNGYNKAREIIERNISILSYSLYQKFILFKFLSSEIELLPLDLFQLIFDNIFKTFDKDELFLFKNIKNSSGVYLPLTLTLETLDTVNSNQKDNSESQLLENKITNKLSRLTSKFSNDPEISKQITQFSIEITTILHTAKELEQEEYQKVLKFSLKSTNLFKSILKNRDDVIFLTGLNTKLNKLKQDLPATTHLRRFYGVLNAMLTVLVAVVETLLWPFTSCNESSSYQGTQYFADNCYRLFHSSLNPPVQIIDDLRQSFIENKL
ncbi:MAG: hypothetical protein H0T84_07715 [Tatlockia sp.]|nr:hypothetical protein [Tatlockia sp.]